MTSIPSQVDLNKIRVCTKKVHLAQQALIRANMEDVGIGIKISTKVASAKLVMCICF